MSNSKNRNSKLPPKVYLDKIKGYRNLVNSLGGGPATRYTLTEDISNKLFEPGLYVIGELSEFEKDLTNIDMHDQRLEDFYEGYWFDINGVFRAMQGSLFANLKTCWGDGIYIDNQGNEYNVDHGSIGCISAKEVILGDYNKVALFPKPFTVNYDISTGIIRFGNIFIDTDFAEVGNREIYFYDPSNTYEPDHPSNKDKTYIDVKIIEYYKVKDLYPKQKATINWQLINHIKDVETKKNQWGEKTNDYGFKSITSMDLLEEIFRKIRRISDSNTEICAMAERIFAAEMNGDCLSPIGAHATVKQGLMTLTGFVASLDGRKYIKNKVVGNKEDYVLLANKLSKLFIKMGSKRMLKC